MKVKKVIKIELDEEEKRLLIKRVEQFTDGGLCEGMNCGEIECSPDCPLYRLDEQAQVLRRSVLDFINGAD